MEELRLEPVTHVLSTVLQGESERESWEDTKRRAWNTGQVWWCPRKRQGVRAAPSFQSIPWNLGESSASSPDEQRGRRLCSLHTLDLLSGFLRISWNLGPLSYKWLSRPQLCPDETHHAALLTLRVATQLFSLGLTPVPVFSACQNCTMAQDSLGLGLLSLKLYLLSLNDLKDRSTEFQRGKKPFRHQPLEFLHLQSEVSPRCCRSKGATLIRRFQALSVLHWPVKLGYVQLIFVIWSSSILNLWLQQQSFTYS